MLLMTTYKIKPFLSDEETKKLLEVFAEEGPGPGTIAHYVASDSSHGVVIADTDDVAGRTGTLRTTRSGWSTRPTRC